VLRIILTFLLLYGTVFAAQQSTASAFSQSIDWGDALLLDEAAQESGVVPQQRLSEIDEEIAVLKQEIAKLREEREKVVLSIQEQEALKVVEEEANRYGEREVFSLEVVPQKTIYLTFDDGPLRPTRNVLKVLEEENVKATLFFVGRQVKRERQLFERAKQNPNLLIANHTYSHASGHYSRFYRNGGKVLKDIEKAQKIIGGSKYQRLAGRNVWRLPEYSRNDMALKKYKRKREIPGYDRVADAGYFIYGWDIEWMFSPRTGKPLWSAERMVKKINGCYRCGKVAKPQKVVLLAHDFMFRKRSGGAEELRKLVQLLKASGWRFDTLDHYTEDTPESYAARRDDGIEDEARLFPI
jgi:peptidoglycan/xylan/chitin deacetylase (PgdA/CDA1 family)